MTRAEVRIAEKRLHDGLRIVEGAFDGDGVDVFFLGRRHLLALNVADAPVREENEKLDVLAPAKGFHRSRAGVAGGCAENGGARTAPLQRPLHEARQDLHREILERERGAVKELKEEKVRPDLVKRSRLGMAEARVCVRNDGKKIRVTWIAAGVRTS